MNPLTMKAWSPYVVGIGIGVLSWFTFLTADKPIGITSAFENTSALAGRALTGGVADRYSYYRNPEHNPRIDWEWMFVIGVFLGALVSARLSGDQTRMKVPKLWEERFGPNPNIRLGAALLGGALMMFGARLAKGCTSGHAISGALQLAVSSWVFAAIIFTVAIATAFILYGREGARRV